ncbi:MFS transporter [Thalassobaculum sp. OXR-137]|uniref:MFS transporter n=1 Tax=Thalassobaculum sp. OXR-137 TaxID=3100173 RepID=UPI002AC90B7C|nr:MFS transporter [Thalassobaculum sp. OXR-137]WPZ36565.1 MFS transporter [Thalassobaculum sp. OXR-137]
MIPFRASSPPHFTTLVLLAATSTMTLNLIVPSLANIARDLNSDYGVVSLALGGYLAVTALVQLGVGPLSDRIGRRPVLLTALAVFTVASAIGAAAQDVWMFLGARMIQAAVISGYVLSLAIVRDTHDGPDVPRLVSRIAMSMALAPMLAPMVGSLLDAALGWRAIFVLYGTVGAALLCLVWTDLGETVRGREEMAGAVIPGAASLFRRPLFWSYALCTTFSGGAFYIFISGSPLIATSVFGVTTAELGLYVGSITGGFMTGSFLAGRLSRSWASTRVMLLGRIVACGGLLAGIAVLESGLVVPVLYFGSTILVGVGNGLTTPTSNAGAMSVVPRLAGSAAGITGATNLAVGALLTSGTGALLADRPSPLLLLVLMLAVSVAALLATLAAMVLERRSDG